MLEAFDHVPGAGDLSGQAGGVAGALAGVAGGFETGAVVVLAVAERPSRAWFLRYRAPAVRARSDLLWYATHMQ